MGAGVDLNSDLGEGFGVWRLGDDDALLQVVTSANVACGFHAGDPSIMRRVCVRAAAAGVALGAQVSYPDLVGFGRRFLDIEPAALRDAVLYQLGALDSFARAAGTSVRYVKPHGALYHATVHDPLQAAAVVDAAAEHSAHLAVLGLPGSQLLRRAEEVGLRPVGEAFADRGYQANGELVPRGMANDVVADADAVARRVVQLALDRTVVAVDGSIVRVEAESICVHGDSPGAVELARSARRALEAAGVELSPFAPR